MPKYYLYVVKKRENKDDTVVSKEFDNLKTLGRESNEYRERGYIRYVYQKQRVPFPGFDIGNVESVVYTGEISTIKLELLNKIKALHGKTNSKEDSFEEKVATKYYNLIKQLIIEYDIDNEQDVVSLKANICLYLSDWYHSYYFNLDVTREDTTLKQLSSYFSELFCEVENALGTSIGDNFTQASQYLTAYMLVESGDFIEYLQRLIQRYLRGSQSSENELYVNLMEQIHKIFSESKTYGEIATKLSDIMMSSESKLAEVIEWVKKVLKCIKTIMQGRKDDMSLQRKNEILMAVVARDEDSEKDKSKPKSQWSIDKIAETFCGISILLLVVSQSKKGDARTTLQHAKDLSSLLGKRYLPRLDDKSDRAEKFFTEMNYELSAGYGKKDKLFTRQMMLAVAIENGLTDFVGYFLRHLEKKEKGEDFIREAWQILRDIVVDAKNMDPAIKSRDDDDGRAQAIAQLKSTSAIHCVASHNYGEMVKLLLPHTSWEDFQAGFIVNMDMQTMVVDNPAVGTDFALIKMLCARIQELIRDGETYVGDGKGKRVVAALPPTPNVSREIQPIGSTDKVVVFQFGEDGDSEGESSEPESEDESPCPE